MYEMEIIRKRITTNIIVMELASQYAKEMNWKNDEILELNQVRIYKKVIILGELIRMKHRQIILCF